MYNFNLSFIRDEITQKTDNGVDRLYWGKAFINLL